MIKYIGLGVKSNLAFPKCYSNKTTLLHTLYTFLFVHTHIDLLVVARWYCGTGGNSRWPSHYRNQSSERGGRSTRADSEYARHGDRRNSNEDDAHLHVQVVDRTGGA